MLSEVKRAKFGGPEIMELTDGHARTRAHASTHTHTYTKIMEAYCTGHTL